MDKSQPWYRLLGALQYYAPSIEAELICSQMVNTAFKEGLNKDEVAIMLAGSITDGLRRGDWPWTIKN